MQAKIVHREADSLLDVQLLASSGFKATDFLIIYLLWSLYGQNQTTEP